MEDPYEDVDDPDIEDAASDISSSDNSSTSSTARQTSNLTILPVTSTTTGVKFKKPRLSPNVSAICNAVTNLEKLKKQQLQSQAKEPTALVDEDEFSQFGRQIATQLRALHLPDALQLMQDFFKQLTEKRIGALNTSILYINEVDETVEFK